MTEATTSETAPTTRTCTCGKFSRDQPYRPGRDCRTCWQQHHVPDAADLMRLPPDERVGRLQAVADRLASAPPLPAGGPGTELKALLESLGVKSTGCGSCGLLARKMDGYGVAGCRTKPVRESVVHALRQKVRGAGWREKLTAAVQSAAQGMWFSPADPAPGLYDEAVRRAAAKEVKSRAEPDVLHTGESTEPLTGDHGERQGGEGTGADGGRDGGADGGVLRAAGGPGGPPGAGSGDGRGADGGRVDADGAPGGRDAGDGPGGPGGPGPGVAAGHPGEPADADRADGAGGGVPSDGAAPEPVAVSVVPATYSVPRGKKLRWAYGVTTVPSRRADLLPRTTRSLAAAGFDRPWLFVDGCDDLQGYRREYGWDADRELSAADHGDGPRAAGVTCRYPLVRAYASWMLALAELYARDPLADRFALFQDDGVFVRGLRTYLEAVPFPEKGYLNLHLNVRSEDPKGYQGNKYRDRFDKQRPEFLDDHTFVGFTPGDQTGQGAMGLVFDRPTVRALLTSPYGVERPLTFRTGRGEPEKGTAGERVDLCPRGFRLIDAAVIDTLKPLGYAEYVHHPSLVQHVGDVSTIDRRDLAAYDPNFPRKRWPSSAKGRTFPGEGFDARTWVR